MARMDPGTAKGGRGESGWQGNSGRKAKSLKAAFELPSEAPLIPKEYKDLVEVFSEECNTLPTHWPTDCSIKILARAKFFKPKMYSISLWKMAELQYSIDKNLARDFVLAAKSQVAPPMLFKEKRVGPLNYVWTLEK